MAVRSSPKRVIELVVNLDDVTPQVLGDAQRQLIEAGALDVWTTPIGMKKQRPGVMLSILCEPRQRDAMAALILELTGSFGVRFREWGRIVLDRTHVTVPTRFGAVRVKVGLLHGRVTSTQPEYDDAQRVARAAGVPLRTVLRAAQAAADAMGEEVITPSRSSPRRKVSR